MAERSSLEMNTLEEAQGKLQVQTVNLRETKITVRDDIDVHYINHKELMSQSFRRVAQIKEISLTNSNEEDFWEYRYYYHVGLRALNNAEEVASQSDDYVPAIEVVSVFEARYISMSQVSQDCLNAFSEHNVGYHIWPYWRELVQSSCARIGLSPSFEIPHYMSHKSSEVENTLTE